MALNDFNNLKTVKSPESWVLLDDYVDQKTVTKL